MLQKSRPVTISLIYVALSSMVLSPEISCIMKGPTPGIPGLRCVHAWLQDFQKLFFPTVYEHSVHPDPLGSDPVKAAYCK